MGDQQFIFWFTDWPSTHVNAGRTVEVVPRAEFERLRERVVADESVRTGAAVIARIFGCDEATAWNAYRAGLLAQFPEHFAPPSDQRATPDEPGRRVSE